MTQNNMFVLSNGDSFVSTNGITFDINEAILFQNIDYVENAGDFKFAKVAVEVVLEMQSTPDKYGERQYAAVTNNGDFVKSDRDNPFEPNSFKLVKTLKEASLFSSDDGIWRGLHKQIVAAISKDIFFVKVYVKFNRVVKFTNDHVKQAQEQFGPASHNPLIKDDNLPF